MEFFWKVEDGLLMLILVSMIFLSFLQIVLRNVFGIGMVQIEPLVRQMLLWVALMGAVVATRDHNHITVDAVSRFLPPGRIKFGAGFICDTFATVICALLTYSTWFVFLWEFQNPQGGNIFTFVIPFPWTGEMMIRLPLWGSLLTLPVAFGIMTLRFVRFSILSLINCIRGESKA